MTGNPQRPELIGQLAVIEGHIRGIARMVYQDANCIEILTQTSAVTGSLRSVALDLVDTYLRHCLTQAIDSPDPAYRGAKVAEASTAIARLVR